MAAGPGFSAVPAAAELGYCAEPTYYWPGYPAEMAPVAYSPPPTAGYGLACPEAYPVAAGGVPAGWHGTVPGVTGKPKKGANKKERRRTMSINNAFAELRECIPNVPADTKLSKIKTLKLATSYITYLSEILASDDGDPAQLPEFKAELKKPDRGDERRKRELALLLEQEQKVNGRTGWPQHVWALELK